MKVVAGVPTGDEARAANVGAAEDSSAHHVTPSELNPDAFTSGMELVTVDSSLRSE